MNKPLLSVEKDEVNAYQFRFKKVSSEDYIIIKELHLRAKPGLQCEFSETDLDKFRQTFGSIDVLLKTQDI